MRNVPPLWKEKLCFVLFFFLEKKKKNKKKDTNYWKDKLSQNTEFS